MKQLKFIVVLIMLGLFQACVSSSVVATEEQKAKLELMMNDKSFNIESQVAYPMPSSGMNAVSNLNLLPYGSSATRIDIAMTANHIKLMNDSLNINLPYYGERQMGSGYSEKQGIDISKTANHIKLMNDSININLPYYGERQMGSGYSEKQGIDIQGKPENVLITYNENKKMYRIKFNAQNNTESFNFDISIYSNLSASVRINSSDRTSIRFDGDVKMLED